MIPALIIVAFLLLTGLGIWLGVRHQLRYSADNPAAVAPRAPDPDAARVLEARQMAERFVFDGSQVIDVDEAQLRADPVAWHGKTIRVRGTWSRGFESSSLAGAWLQPRVNVEHGPGERLVEVEGLWLFPRAPREGSLPGFGHLGMSWGELHVFVLRPLGAGT
ncbi:MAG: hypothetical protein JJ863_09475 [Deltaproteobacteria bacterium]|nr:hypothetical protein [Deltaproteobacteria bacterium]